MIDIKKDNARRARELRKAISEAHAQGKKVNVVLYDRTVTDVKPETKTGQRFYGNTEGEWRPWRFHCSAVSKIIVE